jgi:hypothetical protein
MGRVYLDPRLVKQLPGTLASLRKLPLSGEKNAKIEEG